MRIVKFGAIFLASLYATTASAGYSSISVTPSGGGDDTAALLALVLLGAVVLGPVLFGGGKARADKKAGEVEGRKKSKELMKF